VRSIKYRLTLQRAHPLLDLDKGAVASHGPRGTISVLALRLSFAIVCGPPRPKASDPQDATGIARTTNQVRIWTWAVDHGLRRNVQPAVRYPLNWLPNFDTGTLWTRRAEC
jgi:hypothetical protein